MRDPLAAQPHEPDVTALIRLSDVYEIPLATNIGTAEMLLRGLDAGFADFRQIIHETDHRPLSFEGSDESEGQTNDRRFLRYAKINTRSDASSQTIPTTPGQVELALLLRDQLQSMGLNDVLYHEKNSFVIGRLAGNPDKTAVGFIAHVDTADFAAENIQPQIHENYDGKDVCLNEPLGIMMTVAEFPNLKDYIGETLITTDGTTLLGADDKAGIAEIIDALRILQTIDPQERGDVWIAFGPMKKLGKGRICLTQPISQWLLLIQWTVVVWDIWSMKPLMLRGSISKSTEQASILGRLMVVSSMH